MEYKDEYKEREQELEVMGSESREIMHAISSIGQANRRYW